MLTTGAILSLSEGSTTFRSLERDMIDADRRTSKNSQDGHKTVTIHTIQDGHNLEGFHFGSFIVQSTNVLE